MRAADFCSAVAIALFLFATTTAAQVAPASASLLSASTPIPAGIEIISDTQGADFGPYLTSVVSTIRKNWYNVIPETTQQKRGLAVIEFAILKDGKVAGMKLASSTGDVPLDRATWAGITSSDPLPSLPPEFKGNFLALRFRFFYYPSASDLASLNRNSTGATSSAKLAGLVSGQEFPKYPRKARQEKIEGSVQLSVSVSTDGKINEIKVLKGDPLLAEASIHAIKTWHFIPAVNNGNPAQDQVEIDLDFALSGAQVRIEPLRYPGRETKIR
jgi:TonB family protein